MTKLTLQTSKTNLQVKKLKITTQLDRWKATELNSHTVKTEK